MAPWSFFCPETGDLHPKYLHQCSSCHAINPDHPSSELIDLTDDFVPSAGPSTKALSISTQRAGRLYSGQRQQPSSETLRQSSLRHQKVPAPSTIYLKAIVTFLFRDVQATWLRNAPASPVYKHGPIKTLGKFYWNMKFIFILYSTLIPL